jgi:para-nitrobenzyl esterase
MDFFMRWWVVVSLLAQSAVAQAQPSDSGDAESGGSSAEDVIVVTGQGREFRGRVSFHILPYAEPPIGENRWRPPQPIASGEGRGPMGSAGRVSCQQPQPDSASRISDTTLNRRYVAEDCLTVMVVSGLEQGAKAPVMVWIHGDQLRYGNQYMSGEATFARSGVVYVSFNYRLGVFGFLALPQLTAEAGTSGNYGLMDAIAALQWIRTYIHLYGGDRDNITIFSGQEGAQLAAALIASPEARGLFHRAILQSGSWMGTTIAPMQTLKEAERIGERELAEYADLSLEELRELHPGEIQSLLPEPTLVVDGRYVPRDLASIFASGEQSPIDVIVGSNQEDGVTLLVENTKIRTAVQYESAVRERLGSLADDYFRIYPSGTDEEALVSFSLALSDELAWQMRLLARSQSAIGRKAYVYAFTRVPLRMDPGLRDSAAVRRAELTYVFRPFSRREGVAGDAPLIASRSGVPWTSGDDQLADVMASYWIHFARKGEPIGTVVGDPAIELPDWPEYSVSAQSVESGVIEFGDRVGTESSWYLPPQKIELFDRIYAQLVP